MAFTLAPLYGQGGTYSAQQDRLLAGANAVSAGVRAITPAAAGAMTGDLAVTGAANMQVSVAVGDVWVSAGSGQGFYYLYNDGALAMSTPFSANSSGSTRYDAVTVQVTDSGSGNPTAAIVPVTGTSSPTGYVASLPANKVLVLAVVGIPTGSLATTTVLNSWVTDVRPKAQLVDHSVNSVNASASTANALPNNVASPAVGSLVLDNSISAVRGFSPFALVANSSSSFTIGTGSKAFTIQAGVSSLWTAGKRLRFISAASWNSQPVASSTTSFAISTGSKAFTVQAGVALTAGNRVRIFSQANPLNWMEGAIASYSSTTLTVTVDAISGSATCADWLVSAPLNYMEGAITATSNTSVTVTVDATGVSGSPGALADWLVFGPAWEPYVKAAAAGTHDGLYRYSPLVSSPSWAVPDMPVLGSHWFQTDVSKLFVCTAAGATPTWSQMATVGAWTTYTPTWTGLTQGTGATNNSAYIQIGKTVWFRIVLTFGTTPAITGAVTVTAPVNFAGTSGVPQFDGVFGSTGSTLYPMRAIYTSGTNIMTLYYARTAAALSGPSTWQITAASTPAAPAAGQGIIIQGAYEAA